MYVCRSTLCILLLLCNPWPLLYSIKFWRGKILVDSPVTTKILPSHYVTQHPVLCSTTKYYHPKASSGFIHQKLTPPKFFTIRYLISVLFGWQCHFLK